MRSDHRRQGDRHRDDRDWPSAAVAYQAHLDAFPDDFDIWVQLGHAFKEQVALVEAATAYQTARTLRPDDADLLLNIGHLHKSQRQFAEAAQAYRQSFERNGNEAAGLELAATELMPFLRQLDGWSTEPIVDAHTSGSEDRIAATGSTRFVGVIDKVEGMRVEGWAFDPDRLDFPAEIEALVDGKVVAVVKARRERLDVLEARYGTAQVGFVMTIYLDRSPGETVEAHLRLGATGEALLNSPVQLVVPNTAIAASGAPPVQAARTVISKAARFAGGEAAVFVTHAPSGMLKPHVLPYVAALKACGIHVTLVIAADRPVLVTDEMQLGIDSIVVRDNVGYDFAAWAHVLHLQPELFAARRLYIVNDSLFGPSTATALGKLVEQARAHPADLIGLTDTLEGGWHLQSYFLVVDATLLCSYAFHFFVNGIRNLGHKDDVIEAYEQTFAPRMRAAGFSADALFVSADPRNPTLFAWADLLKQGFPFAKVLLLRGEFADIDTSGMRGALRRAGFDLPLLDRLLDFPAGKGRAPGSFPLLAKPPIGNVEQPLPAPPKPYKVAFYGPWNYDNGLASASRGIVNAIRRTGVQLNLSPIKKPFHIHKPRTDAIEIRDFDGAADIAIVHLNPDSWHLLDDRQRAEIAAARKRIGYWVWEMEHLPPAWRKDFSSVDRIWAPSGYCAELFADQDEAPVDVVPHAVPVATKPMSSALKARVLADHGLPAGARTILYVFDGSSYLVRKNPDALIRAFAASKLAKRGWHLVLKTKHLFDRRDDGKLVAALAADTPGVVVVDQTLLQNDLNDLIASCDIYASPHRSEGFGLTVAEAMAQGRAVVATDFSGTREFLDASCGYPVPWKPSTLDRDYGHYTKGGQWAAIDETALAATLVEVADAIDRGDDGRGAAARARVADHLSYDAIAARIARSFDAVFDKRVVGAPTQAPIAGDCASGIPILRGDFGETMHVAAFARGKLPDLALCTVPDARDHWLIVAPDDVRLAPVLRRVIEAHAADRPDVAIFYADDVALGESTLLDQLRLKPRFDLTLFAAQDYIGTPLIIRGTAYHALGGFDAKAGPAWLDDLLVRAIDEGMSIERIPEVLLAHLDERPLVLARDRRKTLANSRALRSYRLVEGNSSGTSRLTRDFAGEEPHVTLLVPTRRSKVDADRDETHIERYLASMALADWPMDRLTVLIGDDVVDEPAWARATWPFKLKRLPTPRDDGQAFNYAAKMNVLWRAARTDAIVFMNDDVVAVEADWLRSLMAFAVDEGVGGVGPRLLYEDGTIQHAGIIGGLFGTCAHAWLGKRPRAPTYQDWAQTQRQWSAVTGAVFATRVAVMEDVNGFDERFSLEFNDIDLCLRMRMTGYRIVYDPYAEMIHAEKASRGTALPPGEQLALFLARWEQWLDDDPCFHPNMLRDRFELTPGVKPDAWYL